MVTYFLIVVVALAIIGVALLAGRDELDEVLYQFGRLIASPFDAVIGLLERLALWLIPILNRGWAALRHHRGPEDEGHLVMDCVVSLFMAGAAVLLAYTDLALTELAIGPMFSLAVTFSAHELNFFLACSFLVAIAVIAYVAWEVRPHAEEASVPAVHVSPLGRMSEAHRARLAKVLIGMIVLCLIAAIAGMLWRLQALAGVMDWGAAALFLTIYAVTVSVALALATIMALRSTVLIATLMGESLLIADWLAAVPPWIVLRIEDALVGLLTALMNLAHSIAHFAQRRGGEGEKPQYDERRPISDYVEFPAFIFRRHLPAAEAAAGQQQPAEAPAGNQEPAPAEQAQPGGAAEAEPQPAAAGQAHDPEPQEQYEPQAGGNGHDAAAAEGVLGSARPRL